MMLRPLVVVLLLVAIGATAPVRPSTTPGYTAFDQKQFAKLGAMLGTWKCVSVPAGKKPDAITTIQQGNWFVSRETGDDPNTSYTRWSHGYQHFFTVIVGDSGDSGMMISTSKDPYNGTWISQSPQKTPTGKPILPDYVRLRGTVARWSYDYYDDHNDLKHTTNTCTKAEGD
jgi:hypothetical protein